MNNYTRIKYFTLMEIVIAIAILALSLVTAMSMNYSSKKRIEKAARRWKNQHMLSQAAEYYLLVGANMSMPYEIFPYENYEVECSVQECMNLPEGVDNCLGRWVLGTYNIELMSGGKTIKTLKIDKIFDRNEQ